MNRRNVYFPVIILLIILVISSCSDGIVTDNPNINQNSNFKSTFSSIQSEVFSLNCISCHGGSSPQNGLDLTAGSAYNNIVNKKIPGTNAFYVVPGNSAESYIISRISNDVSTMPPTGRLPQYMIDTMKVWIDNGALNN